MNWSESSHGIAELRATAERIFRAGLAAADPGEAVRRSVAAQPLDEPGPGGRRIVIAIGKAAPGMARAALAALGRAGSALVVTHHGNAQSVPGAVVLTAGHPMPDEAGAAAARMLFEMLSDLHEADRVLVLVSGGASALLPAPVAGVSLADKAEVNRLLLASGAGIGGVNLVRQHLSRLKGGGLARAAAPAQVTALILSDVIGDDLRVVASGPTVAPAGTRAEARTLLEDLGLWGRLPAAVSAHLAPPDPEPPSVPPCDNRLVGSNAMALAAMSRAAGDRARTITEPLVGDVAEAALRVVDGASAAPCICLFGGETTVRLRGSGKGGRNQELALRVALLSEARGLKAPWVFLSAGTDGRDGPTDAAGAVVDCGTLARMRAAGAVPEALLLDNDSNTALAASGDLLITGPTGTNVADLQVMIRG